MYYLVAVVSAILLLQGSEPIQSSAPPPTTKPFTDFWNRLVEWWPSWVVAFLIMVGAYIISRILKWLVRKAVRRVSTQGHIDILLARGVSAVIMGIGFLLAIAQLGVSLSAALATVGLASLGVGFALKDILGNMFAGITLLIQHPFTIGDQVKIGNEEGVVENVRIRDTQILTYEGERVYVPNQSVYSNPIINYTSTPSLRIDTSIGMRYEEDIEKAKRLCLEVMKDTRGIVDQPEPMVLVQAEPESVNLIMRFWMDSDRNRRLNVQSDVLQQTIERFKAEGLTIPYPIRTLEFHQPVESAAEREGSEGGRQFGFTPESSGGEEEEKPTD